ncbi:MAG: PDZ domain-containing protein [Oligoflexales bacterium]|nr:PDZ domain-containing protein [Oligoflexales bacterium]
MKTIFLVLSIKLFFHLLFQPNFAKSEEFEPNEVKFASDIGVLMIGSIVSQSSDNVILLKNKTNGSVKAHRVGFTLFNQYKIVEIQANYIIIQTLNFKKKTIKVYKDGFSGAIFTTKKKKAPVKKVGLVDSYREEGFERDKTEIQMSEEYREKIIKEDLPKILMQASAEPVIRGGKIIGFMLDQIDENSIYAKSGLQNGDIVTSINEISLDDVTATIKLLHSLKNSKEISFEMERRGTKIPVNVKVK